MAMHAGCRCSGRHTGRRRLLHPEPQSLLLLLLCDEEEEQEEEEEGGGRGVNSGRGVSSLNPEALNLISHILYPAYTRRLRKRRGATVDDY